MYSTVIIFHVTVDPVGAPQPSQTEFRLQASELRARIDNSPAFLATKKFAYHPLLVSFAIECRFREMGMLKMGSYT